MAKAKPGRGPAGRESAPAAPGGAARRPVQPATADGPPGATDNPPEATDGSPGAADGSPEAGDDLQRKFREALERKRAQQAAGNAQRGGPGGGKVPGAHGPAQSRRSFRRKSGG